MEELVLALPGGPFQEYFAFSLPSLVSIDDGSGNQGLDIISKRFIYAHEAAVKLVPSPDGEGIGTDDQTSYSWRFPMQLGTELAANILKEPSKAFWKDCVVTVEEEVALSAGFKEKYDRTLERDSDPNFSEDFIEEEENEV